MAISYRLVFWEGMSNKSTKKKLIRKKGVER